MEGRPGYAGSARTFRQPSRCGKNEHPIEEQYGALRARGGLGPYRGSAGARRISRGSGGPSGPPAKSVLPGEVDRPVVPLVVEDRKVRLRVLPHVLGRHEEGLIAREPRQR